LSSGFFVTFVPGSAEMHRSFASLRMTGSDA
jgi:hypothetical protein